ncbi:MAG: SWIM zinc finger domain-containing protein [Burkholderiaceae bacterium]|nr:SWIM zinc finger domain-containing protein [Burkholderiaceae bacterium]
MDQDWLRMYRNFDDDALAALASTGLLRRAAKDVEAGKVAWQSPPDSKQAMLFADGQLVTLSPGGPANARCDCPAPGICKHILAATLWLRAAADATRTGETSDTDTVDVLAEIMQLEPALLFKAAGIAATRKAAALLTQADTAVISTTPTSLSIQLPQLDAQCHYIAGAGYAGIVSEAPAASRAALHLLAILAVWRRHGLAFVWPQALSAADTAAQDGLSSDERQFLARLRAQLLEICHNGWAHVNQVLPAQLRVMAMSARIESFPRLAGMLRTLAGTTDLLSRRDLNTDERQAIRLAARILALSHALDGAHGELLRDLRGSSRRDFSGNAALELLPLGAHWWEQHGGARGLTIAFWAPTGQCIVQASLARRDGADRGFNRQLAWSSSTLWQGAGAASTLADVTLSLQQVRLSEDDRISLSEDTIASRQPPWHADDGRWQSAGHDDWNRLAHAIRQGTGLRGEAVNCVLLRPSGFDQPVLDEVRQLFSWTLRDVQGNPLTLSLSCRPEHHPRIHHIEAWIEQRAAIKGVLARLDRTLHGGRLEPLTLLLEQNGLLRAISLDYEAPPTRTKLSLLQRISGLLKTSPVSPPAAPVAPVAPHSGWLEQLQRILENQALSGRLHRMDEDQRSLDAIHRFLRASGIDLVADALRRYLDRPDAAQAMVLLYLCQVCAEVNQFTPASRPAATTPHRC